MATGQTSTDLEQNGRDTNILSWYLGDNVELEPIENYGRLGKLLYLLVTSLLNGSVFRYGGRVDSVSDLPESGTPNEFYLVGLEDSENYDEYFWVANEEEEHGGHWDRLGSVSIIIDDHLDPLSSNPVQNSVITLAINGLTVDLAAVYSTSGVYTIGSYCTKGQTLYKSLANQNPAGEWDSSKWQAVTVMGEITSALAGLATVARTGSYNDLTDKPTIPTVTDRLKAIAAAPTYDSEATYSDGDYYTLDGKLYKVISGTGTETDVGEELKDKIDISNLVTVTNTGDIYVGSVCVRKHLTQAEYDLLDPPDERCDYKIVEAAT